jgi:hypothetical protein
MSAPFSFVISFRHAGLYLGVDADTFAAATDALAPFLSGDNRNADEYAEACQRIEGQEFGFAAAVEAGLIDAEGEPCGAIHFMAAE